METKIKIHPVPKDADLMEDYIVRVRPAEGGEWQALSTFRVKVDMHDVREASMTYFDFTGRVEVEITFPKFYTVYKAVVRPLSLGIVPAAEPKRVTFCLEKPCNLVVEINQERFRCLHLFAGEIEAGPDKEDENVLVVKGSLDKPCFLGDDINQKLLAMPEGRTLYLEPGVYYIGEIIWHLPSHTNIYLEGGVILRGGLVCDHVKDIRIGGRGMVYQAHFERFSSLNGLRLSHCLNITVENLMFINPAHYTVAMGDCQNVTVRNIKSFSCEGWSDGIDMMSCRDVLIEDGFLRTSDDCIAVYGSRWDYRGDSYGITVRGVSVWADVAHPLMIGTHGAHEQDGDIIEDILFEDINILEHHEFQSGYLGAMAINAGDKNTVRRVTYRNIHVEPFEHGRLLDIQVKFNPDYNPAPGRRIEDITLESIFCQSGPGEETSVIAGYSPEFYVRNVVVNGLWRDGKRVESLEEANILVGEFAEEVRLL